MRYLIALCVVATCLPAQTGEGLAEETHSAAGILVLERLKTKDRGGWDLLRRCPRSAVLLIDGDHDHSDQVLRGLRIPFRRCVPRSLARTSLSGVRLVILDCPGRVTPSDGRRLRRFVERGGTLLSTDWAVEAVARAFPGMVSWTGRCTTDDVVRVTPTDRRHPLLAGVFPSGRAATWWLENRSYVFTSTRMCTPLIGSREMRARYGSGEIAATLRVGRGRVVHVVSHLYLQRAITTHRWERRSAAAEARALDLPRGSNGYAELARKGVLKRVRAGHLHAAISVRQFLLNVFLEALRRPVAPRPPRPPVHPAPRPVPTSSTFEPLVRAVGLRRRPGGEVQVRLNRGLRIRVIKVHDGWASVVTPAGQSGWVEVGVLGRR
ncbi:MAG: hypothetical protein CMJ83_04180 [Planctomycetes bacterium]|nr:hypothetical protein [Planctomycetota bacterium]